MDDRAKVDRSSIPSGAQLRGFGIGGFGELVTRLVATAEIPGLSIGKSFKLRGADALSVPLAQNPRGLLSDLAAIEAVLAKPALKELEVLEQLVAIKKTSDVAVRPDGLLAAALVEPSNNKVAVAWPHENAEENGTPESFIIKGRAPGRCAPAFQVWRQKCPSQPAKPPHSPSTHILIHLRMRAFRQSGQWDPHSSHSGSSTRSPLKYWPAQSSCKIPCPTEVGATQPK